MSLSREPSAGSALMGDDDVIFENPMVVELVEALRGLVFESPPLDNHWRCGYCGGQAAGHHEWCPWLKARSAFLRVTLSGHFRETIAALEANS